MHLWSFRVRTLTLAAAIVSTSVSVFAQSGQTSISSLMSAEAQSQAAQPNGAVRRLSMDDAVKLALEQNLGIRIQRIDPQVQDVGIALARSFWSPNLTSSLARNAQTQQSTSALSGSASNILNGQVTTNLGMSQTLPFGGNYTANWQSNRFTTTNLFQNFSPQLTSTLNLAFTQPLMRNFSIDQIRQQVQNSVKTRDLSDIQLRSVITQTVRGVKDAYWDLVYSIDNLKAQQGSLQLSQQSLKDNQKRVEIGTLAPLDVVQSEAEVAANEQGVIVAAAAIETAEDNLRTLILDPGAADFWSVIFEPSDMPAFRDQTIDVDAAVRAALDKRSDLLSAKNSLEQSDVNIHYFRNQILPDVNAQVQYITTAAGGTLLSPVDLNSLDTASRQILGNTGFGSVLGNVLQGAYPNWTVGVQIGYPLGSSTAKANLARAKLQYEQAQAQYRSLEMQVAAQVRSVARSVQTNQKRVQSTGASRELQEKKLEAEQKKLAAGLSSTFFVLQAQRDLALARTTELQAISDYNKSLVDFEAVQQVPVGGSIGGLTTAGNGSLVQTGGIVRTGGS
ncbi:MAG TPA: TolC family protein [Vicinamibacterales bacterium]